MKFLPLLILFTFSIHAEYLYESKCVDTFESINQDNNRRNKCKVYYSNGDTERTRDECQDLDYEDGYIYDDNEDTCTKIPTDYDQLGISEETWSFNIALLANLVGFTMYFLVNFLSILVMRR